MKNIIKQKREEKHLTQQQLAEITNIPVNIIQAYENMNINFRNVNFETALTFSKVLGIDLNELNKDNK